MIEEVTPPSDAGAAGGGGARARLEELNELLSAALITPAEYDAKREQIIAGL